MTKTIAIVVAILITVPLLVVVALALTKPDRIHVERSTLIKAPPEKIFALIENLRGWTAWSPYEAKDPAMTRIHSGAPNGKGAVYEWDGNNQVGKGGMEVTEATPASKVVIKLDFIKPFEGHNTAEFRLEPRGAETKVTWAMHGPAPFISKVMQVFFNMDRMIGRDFEAGLANLKALSEKS